MFRCHQARLQIAAALCLYASLASAPAWAQSEERAFKTSREVAARVRKDYCGERPFYSVKVLKDAEGNIGGYALQPAIRDAPIPFLDHEGNMLATFHIFGSDDEKRSAMDIVGPLTKRFPVQEMLDCATVPAAR
jgi:hypothetical protein